MSHLQHLGALKLKDGVSQEKSEVTGRGNSVEQRREQTRPVYANKCCLLTSCDGGFLSHRDSDGSGGDHDPPCWESGTKSERGEKKNNDRLGSTHARGNLGHVQKACMRERKLSHILKTSAVAARCASDSYVLGNMCVTDCFGRSGKYLMESCARPLCVYSQPSRQLTPTAAKLQTGARFSL